MLQYSHIQSVSVIYVHCEQELLVHSYASKLVTEIPFWIRLQADGLLQTSEKQHYTHYHLCKRPHDKGSLFEQMILI